MRKIGAMVFPGFELLDLFGPMELFGMLPEHFQLTLMALEPGEIQSGQQISAVATEKMTADTECDVFFIPGGPGTRALLKDQNVLETIASVAGSADYVLSVCTGSTVLGKAGVLDGIKATSNKAAFDWSRNHGPKVEWQSHARWVEDGKFFTSSGVSAGMDMALAFIAHLHGIEQAEQVCVWAEYDWHRDPSWDPFADIHGL